MSHQDFEKYAEEKPFNYSIPENFKRNFDRCLADLKSPLSAVNVLDFGCGDGKHYHFFIESGLSEENIYGVEVSKKRIERCQSVGWKNSYFIEEEKLSFPDDKFDIINMAEVIEHVPGDKIEKILSELARVIKKNGFIIITTPNYPIKRFYDIVDAFFSKKWKRLKDDPTHISHYNTKTLKKLLVKYFDSVRIFPYKNGFIFNKFKKEFFLHKMISVCSNKK